VHDPLADAATTELAAAAVTFSARED